MVVKIRLTAPIVVRGLRALESSLLAGRTRSALVSIHFRPRWIATAVALLVYGTSFPDFPVTLAKPIPRMVSVTIKPDPRAVRLGKLFQIYHCPEPHHISDYLRAADGYGLDYRLLPAISIRETQCGVAERENNRWGYHPGRQTFPSIEAGIDYVASVLAEGPLYKGKTTERKLFTYNPRAAYPEEVRRIMDKAE